MRQFEKILACHGHLSARGTATAVDCNISTVFATWRQYNLPTLRDANQRTFANHFNFY